MVLRCVHISPGINTKTTAELPRAPLLCKENIQFLIMGNFDSLRLDSFDQDMNFERHIKEVVKSWELILKFFSQSATWAGPTLYFGTTLNLADHWGLLTEAFCLCPNLFRTKGDRAFAVVASSLWNHLPLTLKKAESLDCYKKLLKTHLFHVHFVL